MTKNTRKSDSYYKCQRYLDRKLGISVRIQRACEGAEAVNVRMPARKGTPTVLKS
jgi:hypothetical protein